MVQLFNGKVVPSSKDETVFYMMEYVETFFTNDSDKHLYKITKLKIDGPKSIPDVVGCHKISVWTAEIRSIAMNLEYVWEHMKRIFDGELLYDVEIYPETKNGEIIGIDGMVREISKKVKDTGDCDNILSLSSINPTCEKFTCEPDEYKGHEMYHALVWCDHLPSIPDVEPLFMEWYTENKNENTEENNNGE